MQKQEKFLRSKEALEYITKTNKKWLNYKRRLILSYVFLLVLFGSALFLVSRAMIGEISRLSEVVQFTYGSPLIFVKIITFVILAILVMLIISMIVGIRNLRKAKKYMKKGVEDKTIYYSDINGFGPFKRNDALKRKLPKVIPIESISELPKKPRKNTLYFCNGIEVVSCLREDGYFDFIVEEKEGKVHLWKKISSRDELEIKSIIERFNEGKTIYALVSKKKGPLEGYSFNVLESDEPV